MTDAAGGHGEALDATVVVGPPVDQDELARRRTDARAKADVVERLAAKVAKFEDHLAGANESLAVAEAEAAEADRLLAEMEA